MKNILHKLKIDYSTYIIIFLALLAGYIKNISLIFMIVLIHELGHVFFFRLYKIEIEKIVIYPFGGVSYINKKIHERIYRDILISLGGIIFQLILLFIVYLLYEWDLVVESTYSLFIKYNINIILFNLIPIIPLDGSKLLLAILSKFISFKKSYRLMLVIGFICLVSYILFNFIYKVNDLFLYIYLVIKLYEVIKEERQVINKFYLERLLYDNYYNEIISNIDKIDKMRIDKYYYFKDNRRFINERDYIKRVKYRG